MIKVDWDNVVFVKKLFCFVIGDNFKVGVMVF